MDEPLFAIIIYMYMWPVGRVYESRQEGRTMGIFDQGISDEQLRETPNCELIGGPLDGYSFLWPRTKKSAKFADADNPGVIDIYERDGETDRFLHKGKVVAQSE